MINPDFNPDEDPENYYQTLDPTDDDIKQEHVETKLLEIDELGSGDCFGDDSLMLDILMEHSVVTAIPTEIYVLDSLDFEKLGPGVA